MPRSTKRTLALALSFTAAVFVALSVLTVVGVQRFLRRWESGAAPWGGVADWTWYRDEPPRPPVAHPRIEDRAGILGPYATNLGPYADGIREDLGIDVRVVTTTKQAESIQIQATELFRVRRISEDAPNGGVLVLLNPALASARIEVSYRLDAVYTDAFVSRIVRDQLVPYASYGAAGMAVLDALHALKDRGYEAAIRGELDIGDALRARPEYQDFAKLYTGGAGGRAPMPDLPVDADRKAYVPDEIRQRYAPAAEPEGSVEAYLRTLAESAGDPSLELFTEGSRLQRRRYPVAIFEERRIWTRLEDAKPLEMLVEGDYAVATSVDPGRGFVPVLLHREHGLWRVDLVETWKNLFFDHSGKYVLHNASTPYAFGLGRYGRAPAYDVRALPLPASADGSLWSALALLDFASTPVPMVQRGDLLFRNVGLPADALAQYEAARAIAPKDPYVLDKLAHCALYYGFPEIAIPALVELGPGWELEMARAYGALSDLEGTERWTRRALERDPFHLEALDWLRLIHEQRGEEDEVREIDERIRELENDPEAKSTPVTLQFLPRNPRFDGIEPIEYEGRTLHDHCEFGVRLTNRSRRPVEMEHIVVESRGDGPANGWGDMWSFFTWPGKPRRLEPGQSVEFRRVWGFPAKTGHTHVRYAFHVGWRGVGERESQRRTQWVDVLP